MSCGWIKTKNVDNKLSKTYESKLIINISNCGRGFSLILQEIVANATTTMVSLQDSVTVRAPLLGYTESRNLSLVALALLANCIGGLNKL